MLVYCCEKELPTASYGHNQKKEMGGVKITRERSQKQSHYLQCQSNNTDNGESIRVAISWEMRDKCVVYSITVISVADGTE